MRSSDAARGRAGDGDEEGEKVEERDTGEGEILTPDLEDFLRSSDAARGRAGDGEEMGGKDEDGAGKRKGAASGEEREGETGERAGKKKKRSGGSRRRGYKDREVKRGERGRHHAELIS